MSFETHEIPTVSVLRHLRENGPLPHVPTRGPESRITAGNSGRFTVLQKVNRYFPLTCFLKVSGIKTRKRFEFNCCNFIPHLVWM